MPTSKSGNQKSGTQKRGFAAMPKDKQREIARKGGEHSHGGGRPPSRNKEEEE